MAQPDYQMVVQRLSEWQAELVGQLRPGDETALSVKIALDNILGILDICDRRLIPAYRAAIALANPGDFEPLGSIVSSGIVSRRIAVAGLKKRAHRLATCY